PTKACWAKEEPVAERQTPKVKGKQIDSGLAQDEEQKPVIDISLLDMLKSLDLSHYGESFAERLATFSQKIGANLRALRDTLYQRDCSRIENIACELSNHALMVGATRMMQSSY